jgi:hypothetical protein
MKKKSTSILSKALEKNIRDQQTGHTNHIDLELESPPVWKPIRTICTIANESAILDLKVFLFTLQLWNKELPTIFLYCTKEVKAMQIDREYKGKFHYNTSLEPYANRTRQEMENMPSNKGLSNLFHDFTMEKCSLLRWAFLAMTEEEKEYGTVFCDADICWLGPMPQLDYTRLLGLSAHEIHEEYEKRYGIYNAGFMWFHHLKTVERWEEACKTSRFFEQAALEDLVEGANPATIQQFSTQVNYGWWRLFQGTHSSKDLILDWSIKRDPQEVHSGILVKGEPLLCIHTHWKTTDGLTNAFNGFIINKLQILLKQKKVHAFLQYLARLEISIALNAIRSKKKDS